MTELEKEMFATDERCKTGLIENSIQISCIHIDIYIHAKTKPHEDTEEVVIYVFLFSSIFCSSSH
jgi:hypothetical protein